MYRSIASDTKGRNHPKPRSASASPVGFSGLSSLEYRESDDVVWTSVGAGRRCLVVRDILLFESLEFAFVFVEKFSVLNC